MKIIGATGPGAFFAGNDLFIYFCYLRHQNIIKRFLFYLPDIPPFREAIYILMKSPIDCERPTGWNFVGTACAVFCDSKDLLLTAGHCVDAGEEQEGRYKFHCISRAEREAGVIRIPADSISFEVQVLLAKQKPDVAVLRRCDGLQFSNDDMIPLCPPAEFPWRRNPKGWSGEVMCFHCPITEYMLNTSMETLECEITQWFQIAKNSRTHLKISTSFQEGSSGGAVVLKSNKCLIGILIEVAPFGDLVLENFSPTIDRAGAESRMEMSKYMEKCDDSKDGADLNSISTSFHSVTKSYGTSSIILVPSDLSVSLRDGETIDLYDWIQRGGRYASFK